MHLRNKDNRLLQFILMENRQRVIRASNLTVSSAIAINSNRARTNSVTFSCLTVTCMLLSKLGDIRELHFSTSYMHKKLSIIKHTSDTVLTTNVETLCDASLNFLRRQCNSRQYFCRLHPTDQRSI